MKMNCPKCDGKSRCVGTVSGRDIVMRRRKCRVCGHSFFTIEIENVDDSALNDFYKTKYKGDCND